MFNISLSYKTSIGTPLRMVILITIVGLIYGCNSETKTYPLKEEIQTKSVSNQLQFDNTIIETDKKQTIEKTYINLAEDTINPLDSIFLRFINNESSNRIDVSFLNEETFDSLKLVYYTSADEQIGLVEKDSSVNVQVKYTDSISTVYYNNDIVHQWDKNSWWISYRYVGYCENGNYDYFSTGGENIDYAIYMPNGTKHDYPYVFSENQEHYFFIDSYDDHSVYSSYILVDNILDVSTDNLILETPFWISNNEILFKFSQMKNIENPYVGSNVFRSIYIKFLIN